MKSAAQRLKHGASGEGNGNLAITLAAGKHKHEGASRDFLPNTYFYRRLQMRQILELTPITFAHFETHSGSPESRRTDICTYLHRHIACTEGRRLLN
jgi:hypothetical protein